MNFIDHPDFADESRTPAILADMPRAANWHAAVKRARWRADANPAFAILDYWPLLADDQQRHLFRRMNYRKRMLAIGKPDAGIRLAMQADREMLANCNLRLAYRFSARSNSMHGYDRSEAFADYSAVVVDAVDGYDCSRPASFGLYAWRAMIHRVQRLKEAAGRSPRLVADESDENLRWTDSLADHRGGGDPAVVVDEGMAMVRELAGKLHPRERAILEGRAAGYMHKELAAQMGLTRPNVQRIENVAIGRMRHFVQVGGWA